MKTQREYLRFTWNTYKEDERNLTTEEPGNLGNLATARKTGEGKSYFLDFPCSLYIGKINNGANTQILVKIKRIDKKI